MLAEIGLNGLHLLQSVERGDVRIIEEVLREHPHMMNQKVINNQEETLLFRAAMEKQVDIVRLLLSRGADPNIPCSVFSNETGIVFPIIIIMDKNDCNNYNCNCNKSVVNYHYFYYKFLRQHDISMHR